MDRQKVSGFLVGLLYVFILGVFLNLSGLLHGCGGDETTTSDAEFEVGITDVNICRTDFDCPRGYVCDKAAQKCVQYGGDVLSDALSDIKDVEDIRDILPDGIEDVTSDVPSDVEVMPLMVTIYDIQDESSERHPEVGTYIVVGGVVATSPLFVVSKSSGLNGFFVQEKNGGPYSGILIVGKNNVIPDGYDVEIGDQFDIWGYYREFKGENDTYSLSEIEATLVIRMARGQKIPDPVKISDPSTIATGGSMSEMYQGVP
ncbi:MAG: hypothetical protein N2746_03415, partial [Deltaproteobacteria bacterium]|nr:hypothetical protein [Deltaproteobacteria bacterium]